MTAVVRSASFLALGLAVVAGCTATSSPDESVTTQDFISPYVGQQGRLLLGFKDPDVRSFTIAIHDTTVDSNGQLISVAAPRTGYTGIAVSATGVNGAAVSMRIAQVIAPVAPDTRWQYVLEQLDPTSMTWGPACDDPPQLVPPIEPPPTPTPAYAMPGSWTADGIYMANQSVSFACATGVAAKCINWGYPPTAVPPSVTVLGLASTATGADMMQACTRMARADYCAIGLPNTIDGTPIHIDDVFTGRPPVDGYPFEAAWPGVAYTDRAGVHRTPAICLSKLRWSTLPLGGDCGALVDPRTNGKGHFCEEYSALALEQKGALTFSSSAYLDAGLYTFIDPATSARLTTASLQLQTAGQLPVWQIPPPAGVGFPIAGGPVQFEATILAPRLPASVPASDFAALTSYRCDHDLVTTTTVPADPSCAPITMEGYVYPPHTAGRAPLRRWFSPALARSWTTATAASTMVANGWKQTEVVGGVVRAGIDVNLRWSPVGGSYSLDVELRTGEWITSCVALDIGTAVSYAYHGVCTGAGGRQVNHADILAFRIVSSHGTVAVPYDGYSSDVFVPLPGGATTAVAIRWNAVDNSIYEVDLESSGTSMHCAGTDLIANDTSYVHTGRCVSANHAFPTAAIRVIRVCAFDRTTGAAGPCGAAKYDGRATSVAIKL